MTSDGGRVRPAFRLLGVVGLLASCLVAMAAGLAWRWVRPPLTEVRGSASCGQPAAEPKVGDRVNVVLVVGCTTRADQTTPFGGRPGATPFLWSLYVDGARFADTITAAPWTQPAFTSITTSRHALGIAMVNPKGGGDGRRLGDGVTTLAERFHAAGYVTLGATANPNGSGQYGFGQGFDDYWSPVGRWGHSVVKVEGSDIVAHVLGALSARTGASAGAPFYLQLLLVDAHQPEDRPFSRWLFHLDDPNVPTNIAGYRAMLRHLDESVAALDRGLRLLGHDEGDTVFVFVGDHGDGLGWPSHHGDSHGKYFYPSSTHVPWVMRGPRVEPGRTVEGLASALDVAPTILGLVGLPLDTGSEGFDWSPLLRGEHRRTSRERAFVDTWFGSTSRAAVYTNDLFCQKDFRRSRRGGGSGATRREPGTPGFEDGCCAWREDPECATALAPDLALEQEIVDWRVDQERRLRAFGEGETGPVDPATAQALRLLGYLE